jgi:hypothetical protein
LGGGHRLGALIPVAKRHSQGRLCFLLLFAGKVGIGFVDRGEEIGEAGLVMDRKIPHELGAQQVEIMLGQEAHGHDASRSHVGKTLRRWRGAVSREPRWP